MTQTDDARGPDEWKCAGCGIAGPDTDRRCGCATSVVCCGNRGEWKTGPTWKEMRARADLATQPDPLADPRVAALVNAASGMASIAQQEGWHNAMTGREMILRNLRAALAAFNTTYKPQGENNEVKGGNDE